MEDIMSKYDDYRRAPKASGNPKAKRLLQSEDEEDLALSKGRQIAAAKAKSSPSSMEEIMSEYDDYRRAPKASGNPKAKRLLQSEDEEDTGPVERQTNRGRGRKGKSKNPHSGNDDV